MTIFDKHREMYRPELVGDEQMGYVFEYASVHEWSFALIRCPDGVVLWRARHPREEPGTREWALTEFTCIEEMMAVVLPKFWTLQLRAKALIS